MSTKTSLFFFLCLLLLAGGVAAPAAAAPAGQAAAITVLNDAAQLDYPQTVTFVLELETAAPIVSAELNYQTGRAACISAGTGVPVEIEGDGSRLEWTWVMSRSGNPPPGAEMWWQWTVQDANGNVLTTPQQTLIFQDERFDWQTVSEGGIDLHWYRGDDVGPLLLEAAVAGLARLEGEMGIELQDTVDIFVYGDSQAMREAVLFTQDWAGALAFSDYSIILMGVPPSIAADWGRETIRHELAHLVIGQFGRSCLGGSRPTWLNEGLAVYAEGEPDQSVLNDLNRGIEQNLFDPVRTLNGAFPAHGDEATLAYSQSYSLVAFLLDNYGQEKMQELILTLASAEAYDDALELVYGFNADGLETAWRASIGAPPRQIPPTPTPLSAAAIPTIVPLDGARSLPTPGPAPGDETAVEPAERVTDAVPTAAAADEQPAEPVEDAATEAAESPPAADEADDDGSNISCALGLTPLLLLTGLVIVRPRRRQRSGGKNE